VRRSPTSLGDIRKSDGGDSVCGGWFRLGHEAKARTFRSTDCHRAGGLRRQAGSGQRTLSATDLELIAALSSRVMDHAAVVALPLQPASAQPGRLRSPSTSCRMDTKGWRRRPVQACRSPPCRTRSGSLYRSHRTAGPCPWSPCATRLAGRWQCVRAVGPVSSPPSVGWRILRRPLMAGKQFPRLLLCSLLPVAAPVGIFAITIVMPHPVGQVAVDRLIAPVRRDVEEMIGSQEHVAGTRIL
jgi:hypothetical protein